MGPISLNEIQHEFENGHLSSNDPICEVGAEEWSSVGQILNLGVSDEVRPKFASDEESEPEQRVLERPSGGRLNMTLTVLLGVLLIVCLIAFLWPKGKKTGPLLVDVVTDSDVRGGFKSPDLDFSVLEENATDRAELTVTDALVHGKDGSLFTGWSVLRYENSDQLMTMVFHENGNSLHGFSWQPNGVRSKETTLSGGDGILLTFYGNGQKQTESAYRQGLWHGSRLTWFEGGQLKEEAQYKNGKLHGRVASFHLSGQKTKEIFYVNGLRDGRYEFLTKDGQKYDVGSYRAGKRDGKRSQWFPDGTRMADEIYEDGELVPPATPPTVPPESSDDEDSTKDQADFDFSTLFDTSDVGPDLKAVADSLGRSVKAVRERFLVSNESGHESFGALAVASYRYRMSKDTNLESETLVSLREAFFTFRNLWDMSSGLVERDGFALSVLPVSVTYGPVTLSREEFAREPGRVPGNLSLEDHDFIIGETQSLFDKVGLELQLDDAFVRRQVSEAIWDDLWREGDKAESANLFLNGGNLSFSFTEAYKKKSLDRNGNSVFTDEQREVKLSISNEARDKKMGRYADALRSAQARTEDFPSPQNSKLVIRKFGGIVIRSGEMLYPNVSVMLAGAAPLGENTLIRGVKVELGEPLVKPVAE